MSDQAVLTAPAQEGISAPLQERVRAFTAFYEQHAYLAYNLALRITCSPEAAGSAVQRGFLRQVEDRPAGLVAATAEAALQEAPAAPDVSAAGDPDAQTLLAAISKLAPAERAALALADLAHAGPDGIGEALGVPREQAANLLERSREAFATALGLSRTQGDEAARDWMWAAPPGEIWEELYPRFHRTVERRLRRGSVDEHTLILKPESAAAPASAGRAAKRRLKRRSRKPSRRRWSRRPRWSIVLPAALLLLAGGAGAATQLTGAGATGNSPAVSDQAAGSPGSTDPVPTGPATGSDGSVTPHKPLTAALLDKLRLRELRQLGIYGRRQADASLPARQRLAASRRIAALERAAQQRLLAQQKRDAALRDRQARQRAQTQAPPPPPSSSAPQRPASPSPRTQTPQNQSTTPAPPANRQEADKNCLMDENTGQYICPH
ncbi:MAG: hypothetical protein QOJ97_2967 [Solirubrobacteraceae bacterium]|nr:hypothetical protein [Solirubrobacteraceae bacterium]